MKFSLKSDVKAVTRDLGIVGKRIVPGVTVSTLNQVSKRTIEAPATKATASSTSIPLGLVRFKHTSEGVRTKRRRIIRSGARRGKESVEWRWASKSGEPGSISLASFPRRRQTRRGVRAGTHFVSGGFINNSKRTGRPIVMKRKGASRYPVDVQRVDITNAADAAFTRRVAASGQAFRKEFERRLSVKLERRGA